MKKIFFLASIVTLLISSCSPRLSPDNNWSKSRWVLTEMKGVPVQLGGGGRDAHLEFTPADKRFAGNGGCNHISSTYSLEKKEIHFNDVIATKMSCPDIAFETTFLNTLKDVDRYEIDGNQMKLKDGKKVVLVLQSR
jgi:heat shock protein HslJ